MTHPALLLKRGIGDLGQELAPGDVLTVQLACLTLDHRRDREKLASGARHPSKAANELKRGGEVAMRSVVRSDLEGGEVESLDEGADANEALEISIPNAVQRPAHRAW